MSVIGYNDQCKGVFESVLKAQTGIYERQRTVPLIDACLHFFKFQYRLGTEVSTFHNTKHYIYPKTSFAPVTLVSTTKTPLTCRNTKPTTLKISNSNFDKREGNVIQLLSNNYSFV